MKDLFHAHGYRLDQWLQDRWVPPENDLAERDRPNTVVARKVGFDSSSHTEGRLAQA